MPRRALTAAGHQTGRKDLPLETLQPTADISESPAWSMFEPGHVYVNPHGLVLSVIRHAAGIYLWSQHGAHYMPGSEELAHLGPLTLVYPHRESETVIDGSPSDLDGPPVDPTYKGEAEYWTEDADGDPILPILDSGGYLPCGCLGTASEHTCRDGADDGDGDGSLPFDGYSHEPLAAEVSVRIPASVTA